MFITLTFSWIDTSINEFLNSRGGLCNKIFGTQKIKSKSSGRTQFIGDTEEGLWFSDAKIWNRRSEIFVQCVSIKPFIAKGTIINKRIGKVKLIVHKTL